MAYSKQQKTEIFNEVCERIINGEAVRTILMSENMPSTRTFFKWLDEDEDKVKQYARAKDIYAEGMFEDIILIADNTGNDILINKDGAEQVNHQVIQRDRLRVDARKWALSKLIPKRFGDKLDVTTDGKELNKQFIVQELGDSKSK